MSTVALGAWRARFELIQYVRSGDTLVFTFLFPIALLALFSTIFGADGDFTAGPDAEATAASTEASTFPLEVLRMVLMT